MNPLLKLELKRKFKIRNMILSFSARIICVGILFLLVLLARLATGILALFISLSATILLFTPASVINSLISKSARQEINELMLTRINRLGILIIKLIGSNIYNIIILLTSNIIVFTLLYDQQKMTPSGIINANLVLLVIMALSSALAFIFVISRDIIISSFFAYLIIAILLFSVIIIGPFIQRTENQQAKDIMAKSSLYINPIITLTRSMGKIDIMRTDYMYNIADPVVGRGFVYPDWRVSCLGYLAVACLFIAIISLPMRNKLRLQ
ncbi:MAG: hypothetical protein AAB116_27560 [Candidatus Poribacteria bacterium]